jgi:transcriptional regulator with XRE-family HTH domain
LTCVSFAVNFAPDKTVNEATKMLTARTSRAARALLDWSQAQLAEKAGVGVSTVISFENDQRNPRADKLAAIECAFVVAGIEFQNGGSPGVRLKPKAKGRRPAQV